MINEELFWESTHKQWTRFDRIEMLSQHQNTYKLIFFFFSSFFAQYLYSFIHLQEWWSKIFMHFHKLLCPFLISHIILIITEIYKTIKIYISDIYNEISDIQTNLSLTMLLSKNSDFCQMYRIPPNVVMCITRDYSNCNQHGNDELWSPTLNWQFRTPCTHQQKCDSSNLTTTTNK